MAHAQGTTARLQRLTSLIATALVAVATAMAFGRVYEEHGTTMQLLLVGLASAAIAWALERRSLLLATAVSGALLIFVLGVVSFRETTWHLLPTLESLREMGRAAAAVGEEARIQAAPTPPIDPLLLAGVTAVWASVFSCHALAFRAGSPLLALVPPIALVAFADTVLEDFIKPQYGVLFLVAGLAVVFADGLRRVQGWGPVWNGPGGRDRLLRSAGRGGRRVAIGALAVAAFAPLLVPGFGGKGFVDLSAVNGSAGVTVSPLVSIGAALASGDKQEVFRVSGDTSAPYWRMIALDSFADGVTWRASGLPSRGIFTGTQFLEPPAGAQQLSQEFAVTSDMNFPWLPVAPNVTLVTVGTEATWSEASGAVEVADRLDEGDTYQATSYVADPDPELLETLTIDGFDSAEFDPAPYTQLPMNVPPQIGEIAKEWVNEAEASTAYDQVLAIQDRLRSSEFSYDVNVDPRDDANALVEFLEVDKTGFCQQFASAMAVMLRTLEIPARVVVGFTQGTPLGDGTLSVTTQNLHSWVEVRFPNVGWLSFEPTAGVVDLPAGNSYQNPDGTVECDPAGPGCQAGQDTKGANKGSGDPANDATPVRHKYGAGDEITPGVGTPRGLDPAIGDGTGDPVVDRPISAAEVIALLGVVAAAALIAVPTVRSLARRRRLRRAGHEPRRLILATYDVFTQRAADLGLERGTGETPDEFRRRAWESGRLSDGHLDRLTRLTVRAAYAAEDPGPDDALDASADAHEALNELRRSTPLARRMLGIYRRD